MVENEFVEFINPFNEIKCRRIGSGNEGKEKFETSRTLQRKISMRSTKDQLVKKDVLFENVSCGIPDVEELT
ncbi:hypothetical protein TNCV_2437541 [Trichonephila clavipes]|nr:hypothetical protein TNCV_2437541 [Trichonephila clavipes]